MGEMKAIRIESLDQLKKVLRGKTDFLDFFIRLNYGLKASKQIRFSVEKDGYWEIFDGVSGDLFGCADDKSLAEMTNIPKAIEKGAFYQEVWM